MRAIYEGEKQIADMEGYLEKLRQRKAGSSARTLRCQSLIRIEEGAFSNCGLKEVVIPDNVEFLGMNDASSG